MRPCGQTARRRATPAASVTQHPCLVQPTPAAATSACLAMAMQARAAATAARSVAGTRARPTALLAATPALGRASAAGRTLASRLMSWPRTSCTNRRLWLALVPAQVQTASASLPRCKTMHVSEESCVPARTCGLGPQSIFTHVLQAVPASMPCHWCADALAHTQCFTVHLMGLILTSQLLLLPAAGFLGGSVSLTEVFAAAGANMTFDACVQDCKADSSCQYVTYRYQTTKCFKKVAGTGRSVRRGCCLCCMCPAGRSVPAVTSCDCCCCCRDIPPRSVPHLPL